MENQHFDADRGNQAGALIGLVNRRKQNESQRANPIVATPSDIKTGMPVSDTPNPAPASPPTPDDTVLEQALPPITLELVVGQLEQLRRDVAEIKNLLTPEQA